MEGIQLKVESSNNISIIKVGGYIDTTTSSELEHHLTKLLERGSFNIVIDLGSVDYVSSAGWGIFISEIKGIRERGGDLKLVGMIPEVYEVFELLEFHYILKAFDTLQAAVKDFGRSGSISSVTPSTEEFRHTEPVQQQRNDFTEKRNEGATTEDQTIEEKVRKIVKSMPDAGMTLMARTLNTPEYGNEKIGWFGLRRVLKRLGLDSKQKRFAYARQSK
jgi:anti-anti-sigma factor